MGKTRKSIIRSLSVLILLAVLFVSAVHVSASEIEDASSVSAVHVSAFETEDAPSVNAGTVAACLNYITHTSILKSLSSDQN